ncbi:MAG: polysaccharide deacetylase family protein [bacterium]
MKKLKNQIRASLTSCIKKIIYILGAILYFTKLYKLVIFLRRNTMKILLYHEIANHKNPFTDGTNITVNIDAFKKQMLFLSRHYKVVNLDTIVNRIENNQMARNYVAITFDDAYRSFIGNALPTLSNLGFHTTIFLIGRCIKDGKFMWRNVLVYIINQYPERAKASIYNLVKEADGVFSKSVLNSSRKELIKRSEDIARFLRPADLLTFIRNIERQFEIPKIGLYLTTEDCEKLPNSDVHFGNHSYSHWNFQHLSINDIEKETRPWHFNGLHKVQYKHNYFAFPFGIPLKNSKKIEEIARYNNIKCLFFANGRDNDINTPLFRLGRHHLSSSQEHQIFTEMELFPAFRKLRDRFSWFSKYRRLN